MQILRIFFRKRLLQASLNKTQLIFINELDIPSIKPILVLSIINLQKQPLMVRLKKLTINNISYLSLISLDKNFSRLSPHSSKPWKESNNEVYALYRKQWTAIHNGELYEFAPGKTLDFPLYNCGLLHKMLLSQPSNKIILSVEINGRLYKQAISKLPPYREALGFFMFQND